MTNIYGRFPVDLNELQLRDAQKKEPTILTRKIVRVLFEPKNDRDPKIAKYNSHERLDALVEVIACVVWNSSDDHGLSMRTLTEQFFNKTLEHLIADYDHDEGFHTEE